MYLTPDSIAAASEDFGFRTVMVGGMNDFSQSLAEQEEWYHKYHGGNLVSYELGFHAEYTTSKKLLKGLSELAHGLKAPVWAHNSETRDEVAGCMSRHGMSPTQLMDSLGLFDYGGGGYHCVWLSDEDMDIFEGRGLTAVTNPASNLKLASGTAQVQDLQDEIASYQADVASANQETVTVEETLDTSEDPDEKNSKQTGTDFIEKEES